VALYAFDGTWDEGKTGDDPQFTNTNVFLFFQAYTKRSGTKDKYVAGIGTRGDLPGRIFGGAFGLGELPRLNESYDQLCENWDAGDHTIDIIGFSRGAATTLDFCNIIERRGIRKPGSDQVVESSPKIRFLGVWDTVAAFGLGFTGNEVLNIGHHLSLPKASLQYCFHAMALDERRPSFLQTRLPGAYEVWFRGVHSDVGGGNGNKPLNDIALKWMMSKAKAAGLPIDAADIPALDLTHLVPKPANGVLLPFDIRMISAVDRCHFTVAPVPDFIKPPATCPKETEADEQAAKAVGDSGLQLVPPEQRRRILAMYETALDVAHDNDYKLDPISEPLLMLFEQRSLLVTDEPKLGQAVGAVKQLMLTTIAGARRRGFNVLAEFFLNEALHDSPHLFPLTD
jgi:hypothetical protein